MRARKLYCLLLFVFIVSLASCATIPTPKDHGFTESEYNGTFGLTYFDYRPEALDWFQSKGLQGGGYSWEALVKAVFELEPSPLMSQIELDSEGSAFNAYATSVEAREWLKSTIRKLVQHGQFRSQALEMAKQQGFLE